MTKNLSKVLLKLSGQIKLSVEEGRPSKICPLFFSSQKTSDNCKSKDKYHCASSVWIYAIEESPAVESQGSLSTPPAKLSWRIKYLAPLLSSNISKYSPLYNNYYQISSTTHIYPINIKYFPHIYPIFPPLKIFKHAKDYSPSNSHFTCNIYAMHIMHWLAQFKSMKPLITYK